MGGGTETLGMGVVEVRDITGVEQVEVVEPEVLGIRLGLEISG